MLESYYAIKLGVLADFYQRYFSDVRSELENLPSRYLLAKACSGAFRVHLPSGKKISVPFSNAKVMTNLVEVCSGEEGIRHFVNRDFKNMKKVKVYISDGGYTEKPTSILIQKEEGNNMNKYSIAVVRFTGGYNTTREYHYLIPKDMSPTTQAVVNVDGQLKIVNVVRILATDIRNKASKFIVQFIEMGEYNKATQERERNKLELEMKLRESKKLYKEEYEKTLKNLEKDLVFSASPKLRQLDLLINEIEKDMMGT